jgi:hypothetical protein
MPAYGVRLVYRAKRGGRPAQDRNNFTNRGSPNKARSRPNWSLRRQILVAWPDVAQSAKDHIRIFVGLKLYGYRPEDIDLVVIGHLWAGGLTREQLRACRLTRCMQMKANLARNKRTCRR